MTLKQYSKIWCQLNLSWACKQSSTYCDFSIERASVSTETEPERFPCWTSVSDNLKHISPSVGTELHEWSISLRGVKELPYIFPMQHHKSSDGHRAFPWQHVLVLSILQLVRSLGNRTTVQMQVSSWKLLPWLKSTSHIVSRLIVMSAQQNKAWYIVSYQSEWFSANCCHSYTHLQPPDDEQ